MIRELVYFDRRLGPNSERFKVLFAELKARMAELGVVVGRTWSSMTGPLHTTIMEREFESLAAYEADDALFHSSPEFMAKWREMESVEHSMRVELSAN